MINVLLKQKGFTLIEIITVVVVLAILGLFTFSFIEHATTTYAIGSKQRIIYHETSYIMERITRELRDANVVYLVNGGDSIYFIRSNTIGQQDTSSWIWYYKSGNNLIRRSSSYPYFFTISESVTQFLLSRSISAYPCDSNTPGCEVTINLQITDSSIPISDATSKSVTLNTSVTPKNFGSNNYINRCFNGDYYDIVQ